MRICSIHQFETSECQSCRSIKQRISQLRSPFSQLRLYDSFFISTRRQRIFFHRLLHSTENPLKTKQLKIKANRFWLYFAKNFVSPSCHSLLLYRYLTHTLARARHRFDSFQLHSGISEVGKQKTAILFIGNRIRRQTGGVRERDKQLMAGYQLA